MTTDEAQKQITKHAEDMAGVIEKFYAATSNLPSNVREDITKTFAQQFVGYMLPSHNDVKLEMGYDMNSLTDLMKAALEPHRRGKK